MFLLKGLPQHWVVVVFGGGHFEASRTTTKNTHLAYKYMVKPDVQQPTLKIDFVGLKIILGFMLLFFCQEIILHIKRH